MVKFSSVRFLIIVGLFGSTAVFVHAASTTTMSAATSTITSATSTMMVTASTTASSTASATQTSATSATTTVQDNISVEKRVREYFSDVPAMIQIARCESNFRQFTDSGMPFRGGTGGGMIGVFQLYEKVHATAARDLGFNLATLEGNIGYARHLYAESGTTPWASCEPTPTLYTDNSALRIELMTKLIGLLQELLRLKLAEQK